MTNGGLLARLHSAQSQAQTQAKTPTTKQPSMPRLTPEQLAKAKGEAPKPEAKSVGLLAKLQANQPKPIPAPEPLMPAEGIQAPGTLDGLANMQTDSIDSQSTPHTAAETQVNALKESAILTGPENVRDMLDKLDEVMSAELELSIVAMQTARNYIERVMVTLKENPEFDSILIDKDVHNLIRFLRSVRGEASALKTAQIQKKEKRARSVSSKGLVIDTSRFDLKKIAAKHLNLKL